MGLDKGVHVGRGGFSDALLDNWSVGVMAG